MDSNNDQRAADLGRNARMAPSWNSFKFWGVIIALMSFLAGMGLNAITFASSFNDHMQQRIDQAANLISNSTIVVSQAVDRERADRKEADAKMEDRVLKALELLRLEMRDLKVEVRDSRKAP